MMEYRRLFAEPGEGRRPTLTWPRQLLVAGEPADVHEIVTEYADWLGTSNVPKLSLKVEPSAFLAIDTLVNLVRGGPALTQKTVAGIHFAQEDSPDEIWRAIAGWMLKLGINGQEQNIQGFKCRNDAVKSPELLKIKKGKSGI
jgi:haloalkane dehalogenase